MTLEERVTALEKEMVALKQQQEERQKPMSIEERREFIQSLFQSNRYVMNEIRSRMNITPEEALDSLNDSRHGDPIKNPY